MAIIERKQLTGSTAKINQYAGHEGQLVFDTQTKHLHVLSGTAGTSTKLANVSDIPAPQDISGKADKTYVDQQLAKKQPIGDYATNAQLTQGLAGKAPSAHTHTKSQITDFPAIPDTSTLIPKRGGREGLAGYEHIAEEPSGVITKNSPDVCWSTATNITISQDEGFLEESWTKVVFVNAHTQVFLPETWSWLGGSVPTIDKTGILILHASSAVGVANYIKGIT